MSTLKTYAQLIELIGNTRYEGAACRRDNANVATITLLQPSSDLAHVRSPEVGPSSFLFSLELKNVGRLKLAELHPLTLGTNTNDIKFDFMYHWMTNFQELSTFEALRARITDVMGSAALATTVAVNKYLRANSSTAVERASLLAGSKFRWLQMENGDWFQGSLYTIEQLRGGEEVLSFVLNNQFMFEEIESDVEHYLDNYCLHEINSVQDTIYRKAAAHVWYLEQQAEEDRRRAERLQFELKSYGTRATDFFQFKKGKTGQYSTFLGVELELEGHSTKEFASLNHLKEHAIFKRDGSLNNGVEICTAPATLDSHKEAFEPFFTSVVEKKSKLKALDNCGMHVHIDRSKLSSLHIANICLFLNNKANEEKITSIAGRSANRYCQTVDHRYQDFISPSPGDRYSRVNLSNAATIEVRMFASTTNFADFCARLEFTQAVVDYTRPGETNITYKEIPFWDNFKTYLLSHRKFYPTLVKGI